MAISFGRFTWRGLMAAALVGAAFTMVTVDFAEARRGGGFGSRGGRTFDPPSQTRTAPNQAQPIDRSMTPRQQTGQPGAQAPGRQNAAAAQQNRGGMFGGLAGGLLGGLMLGGLIGMMMGTGLGGLAGFLGLLLQVGLIVLAFIFIRRMLANRQAATAGGPPLQREAAPSGFGGLGAGAGAGRPVDAPAPEPVGDLEPEAAPTGGRDEIGITGEDLDAFEQLLAEVQAAFTREDFARLRTLCTPEIVSYLSEELGENAVKGQRNEVRDVKLLEGDLSEAWREDGREYATVAMRYESVDVMRDRNTGEIVGGGDTAPTETTELWTFVRPTGGTWQLSAIQDG